jgi:prepilin-type N-terminal cleavage/methylation domain-containing protein
VVPLNIHFKRQHRSRLALASGLTLVELLVTVALIGILSGAFLFVINTGNWRRQRVNAVAKELAGWMEEVMAYSTRENAECVIEIIPGTRQAGSAMARIQVENQEKCPMREPEFRIPAIIGSPGDSFDVAIIPPNSTITYTPRGMVTPNPSNIDNQIVIALQQEGPVRCVRVTANLGLISIGRGLDGASTATEECLPGNFDLI